MDDCEAAIRRTMAPAGGLFRIVPMMRDESKVVMDAAQQGHPKAVIVAMALLASHQQAQGRAPGHLLTCVSCKLPLGQRPRSYAVAVSDPPLPGCALAMPICEACGPDPTAIVAAVMPFVRRLWPGVRHLPAHAFAEGGRA